LTSKRRATLRTDTYLPHFSQPPRITSHHHTLHISILDVRFTLYRTIRSHDGILVTDELKTTDYIVFALQWDPQVLRTYGFSTTRGASFTIHTRARINLHISLHFHKGAFHICGELCFVCAAQCGMIPELVSRTARDYFRGGVRIYTARHTTLYTNTATTRYAVFSVTATTAALDQR
jgi:hypothetical protein